MSYYTEWKAFSQHGFTLVELIIVIALIGIVSVMVVPNWTGSTLTMEFEARHVLDDIRYAQAMSMATGQRYRFVQLSSTTYNITNEAGSAVTLPNGATISTLTNGVSFSALSNLPNNLIAFDSQGTPYTNTSFPGSALASTATLTLMNGGAHVISISPQTGFGSL